MYRLRTAAIPLIDKSPHRIGEHELSHEDVKPSTLTARIHREVILKEVSIVIHRTVYTLLLYLFFLMQLFMGEVLDYLTVLFKILV